MKISEWEEAKKWLVRPKAKPMPVTEYISRINDLYGKDSFQEGGAATVPHGTELDYIEPEEMDAIKKAIPVSPMVKKKIKKEIKVVKKPKKPIYINSNVIDITPMFDDEWWELLDVEPPKEESRLLLVPRSNAEGIQKILNLHNKKFVG